MNANFCQFNANDIFINIYYSRLVIISSIEIMDLQSFHGKDLAETGTSFFQRSGFQYRNQEKSIDYALLRQTQRQRIANLFKNDSSFNQDKLLQLFQAVEEESNRFIQSLLQQLATECRKNRQLQGEYEGALREKNIEARRLSEKNIELMTELKAERALREGERNELQGVIKGKQKIVKDLSKESEGLKMLLQEYQNEFQISNMKISDYMEQLSEKYQSIQLMVSKIDELNLTIHQYEQKYRTCEQEKKQLYEKIERNQNAGAKLELVSQKLEEAMRYSKEQDNTLQDLQSKLNSQNELIEHLEMKLLQANGELVQKQKANNLLKASTSQKSDLCQKKDNQWKSILQDLESKTKRSMQKLKENYQKKIKKLVTLLQRQVKSLRTSYGSTKQFMQKQMLLFLKMAQHDAKQRCKSLALRN